MILFEFAGVHLKVCLMVLCELLALGFLSPGFVLLCIISITKSFECVYYGQVATVTTPDKSAKKSSTIEKVRAQEKGF